MPRKLRIEYPGAIYHVMNRGDRREPIFRDDEERGPVREDRAYTVTDANGVTVTNTYDNLRLITARTYPDSGAKERRQEGVSS